MRPERPARKSHKLEKILVDITGYPARFVAPLLFSKKSFLSAVHRYSDAIIDLDENGIKNEVLKIRKELYRYGYNRRRLALVFALVQEAAGRTMGIRHFDVQLVGGLAMFHGYIAEMKTGEGKTLTASLPAAAAALMGIPVHVITVNDYLAKRDAVELGKTYEMLGLTVGCITHELTPQERQQQYQCDVVYCTNSELVFDYLKDSLVLEDRKHALHLHVERIKANNSLDSRLMLRGLHYAIIDEADSVLMDEARTPLIISGEMTINRQQEDMYRLAVNTARELVEGRDFIIEREKRKIELTGKGEDKVYSGLSSLGGFWRSRIRTFELINLALSALYLYEMDRQYLIRDGKVMIIDEHTGRVMHGRSWERGLHQLIEIKEDCEVTSPRDTLARISYQSFFRKYFHLCGMTGTAREVTGEFWSVYGLKVVSIPTHKPCIRTRNPFCVTRTEDEKWQRVLERVLALHRLDRPVLIGTNSVYSSEKLSSLLTSNGLEHQLLNAKQDQYEAEIIAMAGQPGQVTIATNMAGRGTDIKLSDSVRNNGGLYVILTELHDAGRIDRQLEGRCARQGDPGEFEIIVSLQDHLMDGNLSTRLYNMFSFLPGSLRLKSGFIIMKIAQKIVEWKHHRVRSQLLKSDEKQLELLSFSGKN